MGKGNQAIVLALKLKVGVKDIVTVFGRSHRYYIFLGNIF